MIREGNGITQNTFCKKIKVNPKLRRAEKNINFTESTIMEKLNEGILFSWVRSNKEIIFFLKKIKLVLALTGVVYRSRQWVGWIKGKFSRGSRRSFQLRRAGRSGRSSDHRRTDPWRPEFPSESDRTAQSRSGRCRGVRGCVPCT